MSTPPIAIFAHDKRGDGADAARSWLKGRVASPPHTQLVGVPSPNSRKGEVQKQQLKCQHQRCNAKVMPILQVLHTACINPACIRTLFRQLRSHNTYLATRTHWIPHTRTTKAHTSGMHTHPTCEACNTFHKQNSFVTFHTHLRQAGIL